MASPPTIGPGTQLGPWLLERELGRGGAAVVWSATLPPRGEDRAGHSPRVAIKISISDEPDQNARFQREFELLRTLHIPGVIRVHDQGIHEGLRWYTMEVVHGRRFTHVIREAGTPQERAERACLLGGRLARIVAALHAEGFVHRDIKPTNVLVDPTGEPTLLDFGVVQVPFGAERWTRPGTVLGTLPFMAPEQVAGLPVGPPADVFSLGLLLYEGLLGSRRPPDRAGAWVALQCLQRPEPCVLQDPGIPRALSELIGNCLAFDPADRPTADQLHRALTDPGLLRRPAPLPEAPRFVGREQAASQLIERIGGSQPTLTFLEGPEGSGRHRFAEQVARRALVRGVRCLKIRPRREDPGAAVGDLLSQLLESPDDPPLQEALLGNDGPRLRAVWDALPGQAGTPERPGQVNEACRAACRVLARATAQYPLLILVEEGDQLDAFTLHFLASVPRHAPAAVHVLLLLDPRWASEETQLALRRLAEAGPVHRLSLPDLEGGELHDLVHQLAPQAQAPAVGASPQRATEAAWRALDPGACPSLTPAVLPLAFLDEPAPARVLDQLGLPVHALEKEGILRRDNEGRLSLAHNGLRRMARALCPDRAAAEDRLADAIAAAWPEPAGRAAEATHRARGHQPSLARGPAILAAIAAVEAGRARDARRWLNLVDHLPRDTADPTWQANRFSLAWCRAAVASELPGPPREDLLAQCRRRATTAEEQGRITLLECRALAAAGNPEAGSRWRNLLSRTDLPPTLLLRAAADCIDWQVGRGLFEEIDERVHLAHHAARSVDRPAARALAAWCRAAVSVERGLVRVAEEECSAALGDPRLPPRLIAGLLALRAQARAWGHHMSGAEEDARALRTLAKVVDDRQVRTLEADLTLAEVALDTGEFATARRLLVSTHARLSTSTTPARVNRWMVASLRLASAGGESAQVAGLSATPPVGAGPELRRMAWCAAALHSLSFGGGPPEPPQTSGGGPPTPAVALTALISAAFSLRNGQLHQAAATAEVARQAADASADTVLSSAALLLKLAAQADLSPAWRYAVKAAQNSPSHLLQVWAHEAAIWRSLQANRPAEAATSAEALAMLAWRQNDHAASARAEYFRTRLAAQVSDSFRPG